GKSLLKECDERGHVIRREVLPPQPVGATERGEQSGSAPAERLREDRLDLLRRVRERPPRELKISEGPPLRIRKTGRRKDDGRAGAARDVSQPDGHLEGGRPLGKHRQIRESLKEDKAASCRTEELGGGCEG